MRISEAVIDDKGLTIKFTENKTNKYKLGDIFSTKHRDKTKYFRVTSVKANSESWLEYTARPFDYYIDHIQREEDFCLADLIYEQLFQVTDETLIQGLRNAAART